MSKQLMKTTRGINRRSMLGGTLASVFGVLAGVSVGARPAHAAEFPCSGLPNCRDTSPSFCGSSNCNTTPGTNYSCSKLNLGCNSAGSYCWSSNGKKCCDCTCSYCGGGCYTIHCICYG